MVNVSPLLNLSATILMYLFVYQEELRGRIIGFAIAQDNHEIYMINNLQGKTFGRLKVLHFIEVRGENAYWECLCKCGTYKVIKGSSLGKATKSCGCLQREVAAKIIRKQSITHGKTNTSTYRSWLKMRQRCYDKNNNRYETHGARGIKVCKRWKNSFQNFLDDMGVRPSGTSLDRKNNSKGYCKDNCRWATPKEQANNRRKRSCWKKDYIPCH